MIYGLGGNNLIYEDVSVDAVNAEAENDTMAGGKDTDVMSGSSGNDRIDSREGQRNVVNGGSGKDSCAKGRKDTVGGCP